MIEKIFGGERSSLRDISGINLARYVFASRYCKNKKVLELGCGFGYGAYFLALNGAKKIKAYDYSRKSIDYARRNFNNPRIEYLVGDVLTMKAKDKYNVVMAFEIIEHLHLPERLISLAKGSLSKGGIFIVSTPNRLQSSYDNDMPSNPYHVKEYYPWEFEALLKKFFRKTEIFGIFLRKDKEVAESFIKSTWKWKLASRLARKRFIRKIINYLPDKPKRIFTGEGNLNLSPQDFKFSKRSLEKAPYMIAVCHI